MSSLAMKTEDCRTDTAEKTGRSTLDRTSLSTPVRQDRPCMLGERGGCERGGEKSARATKRGCNKRSEECRPMGRKACHRAASLFRRNGIPAHMFICFIFLFTVSPAESSAGDVGICWTRNEVPLRKTDAQLASKEAHLKRGRAEGERPTLYSAKKGSNIRSCARAEAVHSKQIEKKGSRR
eukprot:1746291-Pleurochrysis_carterae.AAC.1